MRNALRASVFLALGVVAMLALLETALRRLPVTSGFRPQPVVEAWPLRGYEAAQPYSYSFGWAMLNAHRGTTNNYGHISPHDYHAGSQPLIVVGDSYIEALMNEHAHTVQGMLAAQLGPRRPVYGLGLSGLSASDYLVMARQARAEFSPKAAVFLITDGDFVESLEKRPGGYHLERGGAGLKLKFTHLSPSPAVQWLRRRVGDFALYDYLRANLKFSPGDIVKGLQPAHAAAPASRPVAMQDSAGKEVARWFLQELPGASGVAPKCTVLLIDADRYAMYEPRSASSRKDGDEIRRLLVEHGRSLGFHVIDLGPYFAAEYTRRRLKLDYWPFDRHWNRRGHAVAADAVMAALYRGTNARACMPGGDGGEG